MNTRSFVSLVLVSAFLGGVAFSSFGPNDEISLQTFVDSLTPLGEWVDLGDYGPSWHPAQVDSDWAPYTNGSWVYTDEGWYWASDEPWADIVYHYGRWLLTD